MAPPATLIVGRGGRGRGGDRGSLWSFASYGSILSFLSAGSILSAASLLSLGSVGSILSIGSSGSILSIGSAGSILSIGSAGGVLSIGSAGSILSIARAGALLGGRQPARETAPTGGGLPPGSLLYLRHHPAWGTLYGKLFDSGGYGDGDAGPGGHERRRR